jgi:hypothetical protein
MRYKFDDYLIEVCLLIVVTLRYVIICKMISPHCGVFRKILQPMFVV